MNPGKCVFLDSNTGLEEQKELIVFFNNHSQLHLTLDKGVSLIISPHPEDSFDKLKLVKLAREAVLGLKFIDCPYVAVIHANTGVVHIHVVVSRINFDGRLIHQSLNNSSALKPLARKLEHSFGLRKMSSFNYTSDSFQTLKEVQSVKNGFPLKKGKLRENIHSALTGSNNLEEFISECARLDTDVRIRLDGNNRPIGISYSCDGQNCAGYRLGNGYKISAILRELESNSITRDNSVEVDIAAVKQALIASYLSSSNWRELTMNLNIHNLSIEPTSDNSKMFSIKADQETVEFKLPDSEHNILMRWFREFTERESKEKEYRKQCENVNGTDSFRSPEVQPAGSLKFSSGHDQSRQKSRGM